MAQWRPTDTRNRRLSYPYDSAFREYAGQYFPSRRGGVILRGKSRIGPGFDVFIAGAGPAGSATAISLAAVAPNLRICLADAGRDVPFRIGESVPPLIKRFLDQLGVWPSFLLDQHSRSFRTLSCWGKSEAVSNEFFQDVYNTGWHLDRALFDLMLAKEAEARGARPLNAKVQALQFDGVLWHVDCGEAGVFPAQCVVDATGRLAVLSRMAGLKSVSYDKLAACAVLFEQTENPDLPDSDAALVEAFIDGWWYTASIPGGRRIVALMTDADIAKEMNAANLDVWLKLLSETQRIQAILEGAHPISSLKLWSAGSRILEGVFPHGLIAVGDAVSSFDPLSSQGIIKALRSAIFASYALTDQLLHSNEQGFTKYAAIMQREFASYQATLQDYYRKEQRWPDSPFWQRRHKKSESSRLNGVY